MEAPPVLKITDEAWVVMEHVESIEIVYIPQDHDFSKAEAQVTFTSGRIKYIDFENAGDVYRLQAILKRLFGAE